MQNQNSIKTHCPRGHEYTAENTRRDAKNRRYCRACTKMLSTKDYGHCGMSGCHEKCEINKNTYKPYYYCEEHKKARKNKPSRSHEVRTRENARTLERYYEFKDQFFEMYGQVCSCCGESYKVFLTLDHVQGGGNYHRRDRGTVGVWKDAIKKYQPEVFQVLCFNCNNAKVIMGECPHKKQRNRTSRETKN